MSNVKGSVKSANKSIISLEHTPTLKVHYVRKLVRVAFTNHRQSELDGIHIFCFKCRMS